MSQRMNSQQHEQNILPGPGAPGSAMTTTSATSNIFILHAGPAKTGTSSIQCTLQTLPFLRMSTEL